MPAFSWRPSLVSHIINQIFSNKHLGAKFRLIRRGAYSEEGHLMEGGGGLVEKVLACTDPAVFEA